MEEKLCMQCSGSIKRWMELNPKFEMWICNRCHRVWTRDELGVFVDHKIVSIDLGTFVSSMYSDSGKKVE